MTSNDIPYLFTLYILNIMSLITKPINIEVITETTILDTLNYVIAINLSIIIITSPPLSKCLSHDINRAV